MLLGYTVAKAPTSPRNATWFTRPFLLVKGWGLGTRLGVSKPHTCEKCMCVAGSDLS